MHTGDTIIAIASPPGCAARGIVRLSGPDALAITASMTTLSRDALRGISSIRSRPPLDLPLLAVVARGPNSYTGEDTVELQLPGNPVLLSRVVDRWLRSHDTLRQAESGEFTARAYFNGRLTLTEAEGVAATIAAVSDAQLRAAAMLRHDDLGRFAHALADDLAAALALVEAGIDFTDEEDVVAIAPDDLAARLSDMLAQLDDQLGHAVGTEHLDAIPWVVLTGAPNAGKSTLFNALLGRDRAVVSDVAGTTRDVLAEPLTISTERGDAEVMLIDIAGQDQSDATRMNVAMQAAATDALGRAELIIDCIAADHPTSPASEPHPRPAILVRTKADLGSAQVSSGSTVAVSGLAGLGLDDLREAIARRLGDRAVSLAGDAVALRPRHEAALRAVTAALTEAYGLVRPFAGQPQMAEVELIAAALRSGLDALGSISGDITPDDVLGRVFAGFCVGK